MASLFYACHFLTSNEDPPCGSGFTREEVITFDINID
jgi:hypothetical protein